MMNLKSVKKIYLMIFGFLLVLPLVTGAKANTIFTDTFTDGDYTSNPTWTTDSTYFKINSVDGYYNALELEYVHPGGGYTVGGMMTSSISLNSLSNFVVSYLLNATDSTCFGTSCAWYWHRLGLMNATGDGYLVEVGGPGGYTALRLTKNISATLTALVDANSLNDLQFHNITVRRNDTHYAIFYDNAEKGSTTDISAVSGSFVNIFVSGFTKDAGGATPTYFWENITITGEEEGPADYGPKYSNEDANYDSPTIYTPERNFGFQITWDDIDSADNVTFRSNFSGTFANYTVSNTGNTTYVNFTQSQFKGAYGYQYKWYATNGTYNQTGWYEYIISKNTTTAGIVLSSSAGWSILQDSSTTIMCTAILTPTLKFDGAIVSIPYTVSPSLGVHAVWCGISDTQNYTTSTITENLVVNPLIACIDNTTFGFKKNVIAIGNIMALNFTDIMAMKYVKADMSDVWIENVSNIWKNTTDGYFIVVNSTGLSSFTVKFGNYIFNGNYSQHETANITSMDDYTQINPITTVNIFDELTGSSMRPPNSTLIVIAHCSRGENYIVLGNSNDTTVLFAGKTYFDRMAVRVKYTADMYYSRQLYLQQLNKSILNFYVVDAYEHALDRIDFKMLDLNYYNSKLQIYKTIEDSIIIITEGNFDTSHYFSAYLIEDSEYYIRTVSPSGVITEFGTITVVIPAIKELSKVTMILNPQAVFIADKILMNTWMSPDRKTLYVVYNDELNQTQSINITVFFANGTTFQSVNYSNGTSKIELSYNTTSYANESFTVSFRVQHSTLGNSPIQYQMGLLNPMGWSFGIAAIWYHLFSIGIVLFTGGITTRRSIIGGIFLTLIMIVVMWGIGWLQIPPIFIVFAVVISILGIIAYLKQGGE